MHSWIEMPASRMERVRLPRAANERPHPLRRGSGTFRRWPAMGGPHGAVSALAESALASLCRFATADRTRLAGNALNRPHGLLDRDQRLVLDEVEREGGSHVAHVRQSRQIRDEPLERRQVRRHALEDEIDVARELPAFPHEGPPLHLALERGELPLSLRLKLDHREAHDFETERLRIQHGAVALDDTGALERTDPAQARRRREADPPRELHVGDAAVGLQLFENGPVYGIKASAHGISEVVSRG